MILWYASPKIKLLGWCHSLTLACTSAPDSCIFAPAPNGMREKIGRVKMRKIKAWDNVSLIIKKGIWKKNQRVRKQTKPKNNKWCNKNNCSPPAHWFPASFLAMAVLANIHPIFTAEQHLIRSRISLGQLGSAVLAILSQILVHP